MNNQETQGISVLRNILKVGLPLLLLLFGYILFGMMSTMRPTPPKVDTTQEDQLVDVLELKPQELNMRLRGHGTVRSQNEMTLSAKVAGTIVYISPDFKKGNFVSPSENSSSSNEEHVLIRLDKTPLKLDLMRAKASLAQAYAEFEQLKDSQQYLNDNMDVLKRQLELARKEFERYQGLMGTTAARPTQTDQAETTYLQTRQRLIDSERQLDSLPAQIQQAQAQIEQASVEVQMAQNNLEHAVITAPSMLQVVEVNVEEGQVVQPGTILGKMASADVYEIPVNVSPDQLGKINYIPQSVLPANMQAQEFKKRPEAIIKWSTYPNAEWQGELSRIEPLDHRTRTLPFIVEIQNPWVSYISGSAPPLLLGAFCEVVIEGTTIKRAMLVPETSINEGSTIYLLRDGKLEIQHANILDRQGDHVAIIPPSKEPDFAVVYQANEPPDDSRIQQLEESLKSQAGSVQGVQSVETVQFGNGLCAAIHFQDSVLDSSSIVEQLKQAVNAVTVPENFQLYEAKPKGYFPEYGFGELVITSPIPFPVEGMPLKARPKEQNS